MTTTVTKRLNEKTIAVHVRYKSLCISLPSSANKNVKGLSSASARIFSMSTFLELLASRLLDISTQLSNSLVKYILFLPGVVLGAALVA